MAEWLAWLTSNCGRIGAIGLGPQQWPRFPCNLQQGLYLYVLDKPRIDYTLARGPLRRRTQLGPIGPIGLRPARYVCVYVYVCMYLYVCVHVCMYACMCDPYRYICKYKMC